jgi:hypothetical protein
MSKAEPKTVSDNTENSARTRGLKPFQKGISGNPGGRPKKVQDVAALAKDNSVKAMERLVKLIDSGDDKVALAAANAVLDRAVGKPKQTVDMNADVTNRNGSEPVSDTTRWIEETLRARADRQAQEPRPN